MDPLEGLDLGSLANTSSFGTPSFEIREGDDEGEGTTALNTIGNDDLSDNDDAVATDEPEVPNVNSIGIKEGDEEFNESSEDDEDEDGESPSLISTFNELGIIDLDEEELNAKEERDLEWFAEKALAKVNKGVEEGIEEYKESLPDAIKELLDNYDDGVPLGALLSKEKELFDVASISEEKLESSESLQKKMITDLLILQGEKPEDIEDMITDYDDSGLLEKTAKRAHKKLVDFKAHEKEASIQRAKQEQLQQREQYNEWLGNLKTDIDKREEIIPGLTLNDKQKKELYNGITKVDKQGKNAVQKYRESNPDFDLQVAYLATVLKGDFSALELAAETKATRKLREKASSGNGSSISKKRSNLKGVDLNIMKKFA